MGGSLCRLVIFLHAVRIVAGKMISGNSEIDDRGRCCNDEFVAVDNSAYYLVPKPVLTVDSVTTLVITYKPVVVTGPIIRLC